MGEWISLICVLLTANVDTVLLAMGWSLRRRQFTLGAVAVIGVVTTAATWLALTLGHWAAGCLVALTAKKAGGGLLIAMGVWMMIDALREEPPKTTPVPVGWGECLALSLTLAGNNMGLGIGAGLAGSSAWAAALCNCVITVLAIFLGGALGRCALRGWLYQYGAMLSGAVLVLLGAVAPWI